MRPELQGNQENLVKLEIVDQGDPQDQLALLDNQDNGVQLDPQAHPEHQEHKEPE